MSVLRQREPQQRAATDKASSMSSSNGVARKNAPTTSSNVKKASNVSTTPVASQTYSTTAVPQVEAYQQLLLAILLVTVLLGTLTSLLASGASVTSFRGRLPAAQRISFSTSRLPGPLGALDLSALNPNYFANKRNIFNVIFVKQAWAWTTAIWAAHYLAGAWQYLNPDATAAAGHRRKTASEALYRPVRRYAVATMYWLLFTTWFFGPSVSDRILVASGAQCVPASMGPSPMLPSGSYGVPDAAHAQSANSQNAQIDPAQCYASQPDDVYDTSAVEDAVTAVKNMTGDDERAKGASSASKLSASEERRQSSNKAIWQGGHDISGHAFLLSLSSMLLITEVAPTLSAGLASSPLTSSHVLRRAVAYAGLALIGLWWWMLLMTSLFFHTPQEKLSGLIAGFGAWWSSYKLAR